jgi:hypothetical protein
LKKKTETPFGISNFIDFIDDWGESTWAVIAVESPVEPTVTAYAHVSTHKKAWHNAPVRPARKQDNVIASLVPVVQPKNSKWSLIYRIICLPWEDFEGLMSDAQSISAELKTRALAFIGHDSSGGMSYFLYKNGKKIGQHDWASRYDPSDKQFAQLELYVPACYSRKEGRATWLVVTESSLDRIERADIIEIADF